MFCKVYIPLKESACTPVRTFQLSLVHPVASIFQCLFSVTPALVLLVVFQRYAKTKTKTKQTSEHSNLCHTETSQPNKVIYPRLIHVKPIIRTSQPRTSVRQSVLCPATYLSTSVSPSASHVPQHVSQSSSQPRSSARQSVLQPATYLSTSVSPSASHVPQQSSQSVSQSFSQRSK